MVVQVTTEAAGCYQPREQMRCVYTLVPQAVSLALRELVPEEDVARVRAFHAWLHEAGVGMQHILYSGEEVARYLALRGEGALGPGRGFVLLVLGSYEREAHPRELPPLVAALPEDVDWMVCAFGRAEAAVATLAAALGGHARVGFENNLHLPDGATAADNAALVQPVAAGAQAVERPLMRAVEASRLGR